MDHLVLGQGARQGQTDHPRQVEALCNQKIAHYAASLHSGPRKMVFSLRISYIECRRPFINSLTQEQEEVQASQLQVYNMLAYNKAGDRIHNTSLKFHEIEIKGGHTNPH